ncbi:MAG: hypothetical protein LUQ50_01955 [Methanospirillum sp.]|uniref:hypothetical protein n=1 Tax=Methanospirillum sp. TaxID=45200 RepID=UPI00236D3A99|nr:hypothetical protein [Methanospirillum sp.]MDD1727816.1 hypothetical protein [Methanospirillum sp.]
MSNSPSITVPGYSGSSLYPYIRVFALEIQQTDLIIRRDHHAADLITPSGAHIVRLYSCGALTEINRNNKTGWIIRVADPTGVLVISIRSRSQDLVTVLNAITPPAFVSVTVVIEIDTSPGSSGYRLVLETIHSSDRKARDQWILKTSQCTIDRLQRLYKLLSEESPSEEERRFMSRYKISSRQLQVLAGVVDRALEQVRAPVEHQESGTDIDTHGKDDVTEQVMELVRQHSGPRGISVQELTGIAKKTGLSETLLIDTIRVLIAEDELYQPSSGFVKIL